MIDFSNMFDKPLAHAHTPADKASVTFVFQDGMRRSFGVGAGNVVEFNLPPDTEGLILYRVEVAQSSRVEGAYAALFHGATSSIVLIFKSTDGTISELPE
jgi:filamentous hemagglutinin family protein